MSWHGTERWSEYFPLTGKIDADKVGIQWCYQQGWTQVGTIWRWWMVGYSEKERVFLSSLLGLRVWMECLQESCQIFVHDESWAVTYLVEILWICWCVDGGEFPSFSHSRGFSRIWNLEVCASHDLNHQEDLCLFFLPSSFFVFVTLWLKSFSKTCSDVRIYCTWSFSMFSFLFLLVGSHSALISHQPEIPILLTHSFPLPGNIRMNLYLISSNPYMIFCFLFIWPLRCSQLCFRFTGHV